MAYQTEGSQQSATQVAVLHIPHSSRQVPAEERQAILLDDAALDSEPLRMTDAYTDELFPLTPVEAARLMIERTLDSTQIDNIIVAAMARQTMKAEVERRAKWAAILANAAEFSAAVGN